MLKLQALLEAKENLQKDLGRDPTEDELAEATKLSAAQVRRQLEVGRAARNKLIKVIPLSPPVLLRDASN